MKYWPIQREEELIALAKQGKPVHYLSQYFQRSPDSVRSKLNRLQQKGKIYFSWADEELQLLVELFVLNHPQVDRILEYQQVAALKKLPERGHTDIQKYLSDLSMQPLPWSAPEEEALLELSESEHLTLTSIYSKWVKLCEKNQWPLRTKVAVAHKIRRLGGILSLEEKGQYLTIPSLATALEVRERIVRDWICQDLLKANTKTQSRCSYIHYKAVVRFALDNPTLVSRHASKVGIWWLMSLMNEYCAIRNRAC